MKNQQYGVLGEGGRKNGERGTRRDGKRKVERIGQGTEKREGVSEREEGRGGGMKMRMKEREGY